VGAVGEAELDDAAGTRDAPDLAHEGEEVGDVFDEVGGVDQVDGAGAEGEGGDIGEDIDGRDVGDVNADGANAFAHAATEIDNNGGGGSHLRIMPPSG